ncbi:hypothetical protein ILUMI_03801 [Ignelater luminosus]|uniref:Uncharacterized protein n=1 Tax=Ignelater luminosus TaxID=2038154 RepID=A0A8K0GF59_IGNLU|nr:hypothetical protein ILUMI_03801 [Ignelater luminosus]
MDHSNALLDDNSSISILPLAALLTGSLLTLGLAVLLVIVLAVRRSRHRHCAQSHCGHQLELSKAPKVTPQASRPNSMLEINTGDQRYVVAYTLKPAADCVNQSPVSAPIDHQPDILNTPRGADSGTPPSAGGALPRPDALFTPPGDRNRPNPIFNNFCMFQCHADISSSPETCAIQTATIGRPRTRPKDASFSTFATMRRDHIITDSIPGPESCV